LANDFPSLEELHAADRNGLAYLTPEERNQELNLLYVAATRARQQLEPNAAVCSCSTARVRRLREQAHAGISASSQGLDGPAGVPAATMQRPASISADLA
jgi:hypothetical protein